MPFLTKLDSRAAVKGSRDPLGTQPVWTRLGRYVVGNLTTVSGTVTDFTTLLLGYHFTELLSQEAESGSELDTFLKWEQLAGYARGAINDDWAFRGTERAGERFRVQKRATISADREHQIMSDQKVYGLWGLYTSPGTASGLLQGSPSRLSPVSRVHVDSAYLPLLEQGAGPAARRIVQMLARDAASLDFQRDSTLLTSVAKVHRRKLTKVETEFYDHHLVDGGPTDRTNGLQSLFAELLGPHATAEKFAWSPQVVRSIAKAAERRGHKGSTLSEKLIRIAACETVMAPATAAYTYLLSMDGATLVTAEDRLRKQWGKGLKTIDRSIFAELRGDLAPGDVETADRWIEISEAGYGGDFARLLELLLRQNRSVMVLRGGAPWIEVRDGKLRVKFRDEQGSLPTSKEVERLWRHPYFLEPLRAVVRILRVH